MRALHSLIRGGLALLAVPTLVTLAWAQASPGRTPPPPVADGEVHGGFLGFVVVMALLVVAGIAVKSYDMKRKREDEGVALQAQISDALMTDPSLAGLPITPTVHVPFRRSAPAVITVTGVAPSPALREAALKLVMREMMQARANFRIDNGITVDVMMSKYAA